MTDYGNPNHDLISISTFGLVLWLSAVHKSQDNKPVVEDTPKVAKCKKIAGIIFGVILLGLTGFLMFIVLFLGISSLDQAIFGLTLGIWLATFFHFCLKNPMSEHVDNLQKGQTANPTGVLK